MEVVWVGEFLVDRTQCVRMREQLSKEVKANLDVPQGSVFGPLLFPMYVNYIWRNIDCSIRLFADIREIYRKITNKNDIEQLQKDLNTLGNWEVKIRIKINTSKIKQ
jgi:hypothetical protein